MPINSWKLQHVLSVVGQFGLFIEHVPFTNVSSVEKLRVLVAVRSLSDVPRTARLVIRGIRKRIAIRVVAGVDEALEINPPRDTTPSASYFADLQLKLRHNPPPSHGFNRQQPKVTSVTLDFKTAFKAWAALPPSTEKEELGRRLQDSPYWSIARNQERLGRLPPPPPPLPLSQPPLSEPITFRHTVCDTLILAKSQEGTVAVEDPTCNVQKSRGSAPLYVGSPQPTATPLVASSAPKQRERAPQTPGLVLPPHVSLSSDAQTFPPSAESPLVPPPGLAPQPDLLEGSSSVGCSADPLPSSGFNCQIRQPSSGFNSHIRQAAPLLTHSESFTPISTHSAHSTSPSPSPISPLPRPTNLALPTPPIRAVNSNPSPIPFIAQTGRNSGKALRPSTPTQALSPSPSEKPSSPSPALSPPPSGKVEYPNPGRLSLLRRSPSPPLLHKPSPPLILHPTVPVAPATSPADTSDIRRSSRLGKPNKKLQGFHVGTKRKTTKEGGNISKKAIQTALQEAGVTRTLHSVREADAFLSSDERTALRGYCSLLPSADGAEPLPERCTTSTDQNEAASDQTCST